MVRVVLAATVDVSVLNSHGHVLSQQMPGDQEIQEQHTVLSCCQQACLTHLL